MSKLNPEQIEEIKENFDLFDTDNNGIIDYSEFAKLIEAIGLKLSDDELKKGFQTVDTDQNGKIEFDEFVAWWGEQN